MKRCPCCNLEKPDSEFWKCRSRKDGKATYCKTCAKKRRQNWEKNNKGRRKNYSRAYRKTPRGLFAGIKSRAIKRGISVELTCDEFVRWFNKQDLNCYYCDSKLVFPVIGSRKVQGLKDLTIDRKDNKLGYTKDNIVISCSRCNIIKGSWFTAEQMHKIWRAIGEN